jgi:NAD+ synthase
MHQATFNSSLLSLNCDREVRRIEAAIQETVLRQFRKKGVVVAMSGGVDSSVVAALAVRALGKERVFGLLMPERDSAAETLSLSQEIVSHLGIEHALEDISPILDVVGCYRRRDAAIQRVVPDFVTGDKSKLVLPALSETRSYRLFSVVVQHQDGRITEAALRQISNSGREKCWNIIMPTA